MPLQPRREAGEVCFLAVLNLRAVIWFLFPLSFFCLALWARSGGLSSEPGACGEQGGRARSGELSSEMGGWGGARSGGWWAEDLVDWPWILVENNLGGGRARSGVLSSETGGRRQLVPYVPPYAWPPHRLSSMFVTLRCSKMPILNVFKDFVSHRKRNDGVVTIHQEIIPCAELVSSCEEVSHWQFDIFFVDLPAVSSVWQGHRQVDIFLCACLMSSSLSSDSGHDEVTALTYRLTSSSMSLQISVEGFLTEHTQQACPSLCGMSLLSWSASAGSSREYTFTSPKLTALTLMTRCIAHALALLGRLSVTLLMTDSKWNVLWCNCFKSSHDLHFSPWAVQTDLGWS